jgi:hypothetical protein
MNQKTILVVLVVIGLLFFVGIGRGFMQVKEEMPPWVKNIGTLIPKIRASFEAVVRSNHDSICLDSEARLLNVPAGFNCRYTLTSSFLPRSLTLELASGRAADVELYQPVNDRGVLGITYAKKLEIEEAASIDLFAQRSKNSRIQLSISCLDPTENCRLQIEE